MFVKDHYLVCYKHQGFRTFINCSRNHETGPIQRSSPKSPSSTARRIPEGGHSIFMHDSDPCYRTNNVTEFLRVNNIEGLGMTISPS